LISLPLAHAAEAAPAAAAASPTYKVADPLPLRGRLSPVLEYQVNAKPYLFVGETNTILALDEVTAELVRELGRDGATDKQALDAVIPRFGQDATLAAFKELRAERVIRPNELVVLDRPGRPPEFPVRSVVLNLAQGCNLSCSYCFADEGLYHDKQYGFMSAEMARQGVDFAFHEGQGHVHITFFGGEPTLNWPVLVEAVRHGEERAAREGRTIDFSLTTNASLLGDERIAFLAEHRIGVSVSLDGPPDVNDAYRTRKDGKGSSADVVPRIKRLLAGHRTRPIAARVTLAAGNTDVERIFDYLMALGFHEVGFAPVTTARADLQLPPADLEQILAGLQDLGARTHAAARQGRFLGFSNLINTWQELHEGKIKSHGCGAGIGLLSVGATGGLYLCHRFTGSGEHQFGDLADGIDRQARGTFLQAAHVANKGTCQTCWLKHTCAGGCYHEAWERLGSALEPNAHYCDFMRQWMEFALITYTDLAENHPRFITEHLAKRMRDR